MSVTFERIMSPDHPDFERIWALYESSFPVHEQRTREKQAAVLSNSLYCCEVIREEGEFFGLLMSWETPEFIYVEHFATTPEVRGQGLGARALDLLGRRGKPVVLEIDPPEDGIALRRKGFYERCGFSENPFPHIHPPYRPDYQGHALMVMTAPESWNQKEYERFFAFLRDVVMADCKVEQQEVPPTDHRTGDSRDIKLLPLAGVEWRGMLVPFGSLREKADQVFDPPEGEEQNGRRYYLKGELRLDFDKEGRLEFAECLGGEEGVLRPWLYGLPAFETDAEELLEQLKEKSGGPVRDEEEGVCCVFPEISVGLFREITPAAVEEMIRELSQIELTALCNVDLSAELHRAHRWDSIGIGREEYYAKETN